MSADSDDGTLRSGFQLVTTYRGHRSAIRSCVYNALSKVLLSVDERCVRLWKADGHDVGSIVFPMGKACFIMSMIWIPELKIYFGACLDRCLKVQ